MVYLASDDEAYETTVDWLERIRSDDVPMLDALTKWYVPRPSLWAPK
jgi:hypothetical protein